MKYKIYVIPIALTIVMMTAYVIAETVITDGGINSGGYLTLVDDEKITLVADEIDTITEGSPIELYANTNQSRPSISFMDNYTNPGSPVIMGYIICHKTNPSQDLHQHCAFETANSSGAVETRLELSYDDDPTNSYIKITNVDDFILGSGVDFRMAGSDLLYEGNRFDIYTENKTTVGLGISNDSDGVVLTGLDVSRIEFADDIIVGSTTKTGIIQIYPNTTSRSCYGSREGEIRFDTDSNKHYGCDGANWNALY